MTDELVKRLRERCILAGFGKKLVREATDHIESLTAELADAEALIEAQAKDHASNNIRFAEAEHRAKTAEAERNQLREALEQFLIEYDVVDLAHAEPSSLTEAVLAARAALKGESHE